METPKEYYYTYYSYEEWGRGYIGSRGCKCLPEKDINYLGSCKDKNFKPTQKIILKSDYATREEAYADEIILQQYYKVVGNPHFANRAYQTSTKFYYITPKEEAIKRGKRIGKKLKELGLGFHKWTKEQYSENSKKSGSISGKKHKENKTGIFGLTEDQWWKNRSKGGSIGGKIGSKTTNSQKWMCLETGFISNSGGLSHYQKKRGIDKSKRIKL
jgi:hypothetical protein